MRNLDILAAENGEHVRVLLCGEEQSYVVSCQHFRMPYPVVSDLLAELQPVPAETYSVFVLDSRALCSDFFTEPPPWFSISKDEQNSDLLAKATQHIVALIWLASVCCVLISQNRRFAHLYSISGSHSLVTKSTRSASLITALKSS